MISLLRALFCAVCSSRQHQHRTQPAAVLVNLRILAPSAPIYANLEYKCVGVTFGNMTATPQVRELSGQCRCGLSDRFRLVKRTTRRTTHTLDGQVLGMGGPWPDYWCVRPVLPGVLKGFVAPKCPVRSRSAGRRCSCIHLRCCKQECGLTEVSPPR